MVDYSTHNISQKLLKEIEKALKEIDYGSLELYVNNGRVVQITQRKIKKTESFLTKEGK